MSNEANDHLWPENFGDKAKAKLANLMKHKYQPMSMVKAVRIQKGDDDLLIIRSGEVFKKVVY